MGFFMSVVYEGIECKYKTTLSRDWVKLKKKKCIGDISQHRIRNRNKPIIKEMDPSHEVGLSEGIFMSQLCVLCSSLMAHKAGA